ncbi:MAG: ABC transporter permease [Chitinophagaceae bacterium]|nr:MAG: ABC transporter permease [Chitinophagaceae bacterium]
MFKNFFLTAWRNLYKNKLFTVLHVFGLALGMSLCLLYIAWLVFIFTYDNFHPDKDRIYRVTSMLQNNEENPYLASAPVEVATHLEKDITGVEKVVRINTFLGGEMIHGDKKFYVDGYFADAAFFQVFNFPLIKGDKITALSQPNSIVISETEAKKFFGDKEPMGQMIKAGPYGDLMITGICKDVPENSHIQFDAIASFVTYESYMKTLPPVSLDIQQAFMDSYIYMLLSKNTEPDNIQQSLNKITKQRYTKKDFKATFKLQRLDKIAPGPDIYNSIGPTWGYLSIFLIGSITLVILIPACSNYINLSISQSLERMREIGVRKVLGGRRKHIMLMFIVESTVVALLALVFSYLIFEVIRKDYLYQMIDTVRLDLTPTIPTIVGFILFALVVGVTAGAIPALYFLRVTPIDAMKGKELKSSGRSWFRKIILTSQFILSLGFTMAVLIMIRQYNYSVNYDFGFEQENVLDVDLQNIDPQIFTNEYGKLSPVKTVSLSSHVLGVGAAPEQFVKVAHGGDSLKTSSISINEAFIANMKLELLAGSDFSTNVNENARHIIINEVLAKTLSPKDPFAAIDKSLILADGSEVRIVGILKNFHYSGLKELIKSFFFEYKADKFRYANLKLQTGDLASVMPVMESTWKKIGGEGKFTSQLFSDEIKDAYSYYVTIVKLWGFLGILAITVACLGLLGSVSFTTRKRFKEISIRKVMGASSNNLVLLLSKDFLILLVIATLITVPLVYFMFEYLLSTIQSYNIQIGIFEIGISLLIVLVLGLTTILSQTLRAANSNPVDNLRAE